LSFVCTLYDPKTGLCTASHGTGLQCFATRRVNKAILQSQYSSVSKLLVDMLTHYEKEGSTALLRSVSA